MDALPILELTENVHEWTQTKFGSGLKAGNTFAPLVDGEIMNESKEK
jgi:hypothetical protein